jgi:hypothetical protein
MDDEISKILKNKNTYRRSTPKERAKLEKSREKMKMGMEGEKDFLSKISTTMKKAARDEMNAAEDMYYSVPKEAREYEAYQAAGYAKGGEVVKVKGYGAARKGKGCKIC